MTSYLLLENYPLIGGAAGSFKVGIGRSAPVQESIIPLPVHNGLMRLKITDIEFNFDKAIKDHDLLEDLKNRKLKFDYDGLYQIMFWEFIEVPQWIVFKAIVNNDTIDLFRFIRKNILYTFIEITSLSYDVV